MRSGMRASLRAKLAVLIAVACLGEDRAGAAGFLVYDLTGEALGKASALSASITDPSAVWFNPAGIAYTKGWQAVLSGVYITASNRFEPKDGGRSWSAERRHFFLPSVYVAGRILDWLSAGLGVFTPYGLGTTWPEDWVGREYAIDTNLQTVVINPTLTFRLHRNVSLGIGGDIVYSSVDMTSGLPAVMGGTARIGGQTWSGGANAGLLWKVLPERFHAAITYRSRVKLSFDGKGDFDPEHIEFARSVPDQGGKAEITLPDILTVGFAYWPRKDLVLTLDTNVTFWSVYDKLVLDLETSPDIIKERNWHEAVTVRLGIEWTAPLDPRNGILKVRGGLIFDQNPAPSDTLDPSLPDANRVDFALGLGYEWRWVKADLGYMLVYFLPSEATGGQEGPEGTYYTTAHMLGLTVTGRFGQHWRAEEF